MRAQSPRRSRDFLANYGFSRLAYFASADERRQ
jgi:hypothetical protein